MRTFLFKPQQKPRVGVDVGMVQFHHHLDGQRLWQFSWQAGPAAEAGSGEEAAQSQAEGLSGKERRAIPELPSTSSATGQRLGRHVRQEINRAVNEMIKDHPHTRIIYEELNRGLHALQGPRHE